MIKRKPQPSYKNKTVSAIVGGEERSQLVGGNVTSVDLRQLDEGAQYEVKVLALVRNREGPPVSVRVTTGVSCLSVMFVCFSVSSHIYLYGVIHPYSLELGLQYRFLILFRYISIPQNEYLQILLFVCYLIIFYFGLAKDRIKFTRDVSLQSCIDITVCCTGGQRGTRVEGLRLLDSTPGGLRITWRAVSGASSYRIYWRSSQGSYTGTRVPTHTNQTQLTLCCYMLALTR